MFRLLGLHPGPDISVPAAASMAGIPGGPAAVALRELARFHLATEHAPGRFTLHDLLRVYAAEQARTLDSEGERRAAVHRALDHYLHTARAGAVLLLPPGMKSRQPQPSLWWSRNTWLTTARRWPGTRPSTRCCWPRSPSPPTPALTPTPGNFPGPWSPSCTGPGAGTNGPASSARRWRLPRALATTTRRHAPCSIWATPALCAPATTMLIATCAGPLACSASSTTRLGRHEPITPWRWPLRARGGKPKRWTMPKPPSTCTPRSATRPHRPTPSPNSARCRPSS